MAEDGRLVAAERLLDERLDENGVALTPEMLKLIRELKVIIKEQNAKIAHLEQALEKVAIVATPGPIPEARGVEYDLNRLIRRIKYLPKDDTDQYYWDAVSTLEWELERITIYKLTADRYALESAYRKYKNWKNFNRYFQWTAQEWSALANSTGAYFN